MAIIIFNKLTSEEQKISNEFFDICNKFFPDKNSEAQDKFDRFFSLFVELCHAREIDVDYINPNQLEMNFDE